MIAASNCVLCNHTLFSVDHLEINLNQFHDSSIMVVSLESISLYYMLFYATLCNATLRTQRNVTLHNQSTT